MTRGPPTAEAATAFPPRGSQRCRPTDPNDGLRSLQTVARALLLLVLGLGVILGAAGAPEGAYDDDREGGGAAASPSAAAGAAVLARRSHRLIGGGDGPASGAAASAAATAAGEGHEAYVAARRARMPLELFTRVLHTPAEGELAGEEGLLHDALDFQWRLLAATPAKPAPYLVCGAYGQGRALAGMLRRDMGEGRFRTVHASRSGDATCFLAHATYAYATGLLPQHLRGANKAASSSSAPVTYVEPLPAHLKISPDFIAYTAQDATPAVGGLAALRLKVARLREQEQGRAAFGAAPTATPTPAPTAAPTPAPTTSPLDLERAGPELILTFSPGAKVGRHLQFLLKRWRKVLPKLGRLSTGGFQEHFFWTAHGHGPPDHHHQDDPTASSTDTRGKANVTSAEGAWRFEGRRAAWRATLARLEEMQAGNRSCGFEGVRFLDETETHVVLSGISQQPPSPSSSSSILSEEEEEEDRHACLVGLAAFVAAHPDVLSVQMRARYGTANAVASWIIQSGDEQTHAQPLWELGLTGKGELIGVSDTGLDDEHCYFFDAARGRVPRSAWDRPVTDMQQRKVVQYVSFVDGGDFVEGHGTHVAGSIAGVLGPGWAMHGCGDGETLACTGTCLTQDDCRLPEYGYLSCRDWRNDAHCDPWFACPLHGCDGGDCGLPACGADPEEALEQNAGLAREAKIAFFDLADSKGNLSTPSDFNRMLFPPAYDAGARIHSNSWGVNIGGYLFDDSQIDRFAYEHQDMLVIYAGGNYGEQGFHSIGSPGTTKNALTIGATESGPERLTQDREVVAKFSSRGPTYDGRLKPDVVAPGSYIYSARSSGYDNGGTCAYVAMAGTSMAAPVVAGVAALLRQYFKEGHYGRALRRRGECSPPYTCEDGGLEPSAPLLKALFVNSAVPVRAFRLPSIKKEKEGKGQAQPQQSQEQQEQEEEPLVPLPHPPDLAQGHGRVKIDAVLDFHGAHSLFLVDRVHVRSGQLQTYYFRVDDEQEGGVPLQVTLAWIDPPNAFTARKQLLHDLDLLVIDPAGRRHHPNGLPGPDERNNVEKVVIAAPVPPGVYRLVVKAGELTEADLQAYALVATGAGRAVLEEEALPLLIAEGEEEAIGGVSLDAVLHPCFAPCLQQQPATDADICTQLAVALQGAVGSCPPHAIMEAREVCLGPHARCGLAACGVALEGPAKVQAEMVGEGGEGGEEEARYYKVAVRLVLRGLEEGDLLSVEKGDGEGVLLRRELVAALEAWLGVDETAEVGGRPTIRLMHVNGRALPSDSPDDTRRRLLLFGPTDPAPRFSSPAYGVALGVEVLAPLGKAQGRRLQARMAGSYGHLNDHLRALATHPRLRGALAFDVQTHVASYRLLPATPVAPESAEGQEKEPQPQSPPQQPSPSLVFDERREEDEPEAAQELTSQEAAAIEMAGAGYRRAGSKGGAAGILSSPLLLCLSIMMVVVGLASLAVEALRRWLPSGGGRGRYSAQVHTEGVVVMGGKKGGESVGVSGGGSGGKGGCCKVLLVARSRCNTEDEEREREEEAVGRRERQRTADALIGEEFDWMRVRAPSAGEEGEGDEQVVDGVLCLLSPVKCAVAADK